MTWATNNYKLEGLFLFYPITSVKSNFTAFEEHFNHGRFNPSFHHELFKHEFLSHAWKGELKVHVWRSIWILDAIYQNTYTKIKNKHFKHTENISQTSLLNLTFQSQKTFGKSSWLVVISSLLDFLFWYLLSSKLSRWTIVFKTLISSSDSEFCGKVTEGAFWSPK